MCLQMTIMCRLNLPGIFSGLVFGEVSGAILLPCFAVTAVVFKTKRWWILESKSLEGTGKFVEMFVKNCIQLIPPNTISKESTYVEERGIRLNHCSVRKVAPKVIVKFQ